MDEVGGCGRGRGARHPRPPKPVRFCCWLIASAFACLAIDPAQTQERAFRSSPSEYEVKAAFLLNFTKFIEWPVRTQGSERAFAICIAGEDPFGSTLDQIVEGERIEGRRLTVRRIGREPANGCEVLFFSKSERDVARVLSSVPSGVLTVGETDTFLRQGGMLGFVVEDRRVRFDIDLRAAARGGFKVSSRLLNVARSVEK